MARRKQLHKNQILILKELERNSRMHNSPPTYRELGAAADITSTSVVNHHLKKLEQLGYIARDKGVSRCIRLLKLPPELQENEEPKMGQIRQIQIYGRIQAGAPIPVPSTGFGIFDPDHCVDVPENLLTAASGPLFALEVKGDSMMDAMVAEKDIVILRQAQDANNGDMVAAWLVNREETTLKYFYRENGRIRLQPANSNYDPIYVAAEDGLIIQGKVVLIIRKPANRPL